LRVLFLQEEIADKTIQMLKGALQELRVGNPDRLATDIGPVIDGEAQGNLLAHIARMKTRAKQHFALDLPPALLAQGTFVAPTVLEIASLAELEHEVFGPVLHIVRYRRADLGQVIDAINASGYGLTLGVHSRIDETVDFVTSRAHVGNIYVNRNIVGAVVGVQPFGGEGKSGTGPKAGGPLYLKRLQANGAPLLRHDSPAYAGLTDLLVWAKHHGYHDLVTLGQDYARTQLNGVTLPLPGPTGEQNQLSFCARGAVLCAAHSLPAFLNQLAAVLASGNRAFVLASAELVLPDDLPAEVRDCMRVIGAADLDACNFDLALIETGTHASLPGKLAARPGALIGLVDTSASAPLPLWRLVAERALCINTTAAGGNASLMTLGL
jgi:RHH-type proline utilization regulon transcriptional repressor/proline dehydrogenase/delta 1-pyrroline-5-carboxylate dehydrogenase